MKTYIGIIGALSDEVDGLVAALKKHKTERISGIDFHIGILAGKKVVIAKCGVGKVFAAIAAEAMILKYSPKLIVNTGVGGALAAGLIPSDIVIAETLVQHDMDTSPIGDPKGLISGINVVYFEADKRAVSILKDAADGLGLRSTVGRVATGDQFVASREQKESIVSEFSAAACEMEGCAVAQAAYVNNTPFAVIRAISDSADGGASMDYMSFLPIAVKNSMALTLALVEKY